MVSSASRLARAAARSKARPAPLKSVFLVLHIKLRILIAGQFINGRIVRFGWQRIVALAARIQFLQPQDREAINALPSCDRCAS